MVEKLDDYYVKEYRKSPLFQINVVLGISK